MFSSRRMKSFNQFLTICEAIYDRDKKSDVDLEVGKIGKDRKKTAPERRRTKRVGGGKTAPAKEYKPRKDIGKQRQASTRVQQPTRERGSAALSPKEAQRKAYLERKKKSAAKDEASGKDKRIDLQKSATKLLSKKKTKAVDPKYKATGKAGHTGTSKREYSRPERQKLRRASDRLLSDIKKKKEKPASHYDPKLGE